MRIEIDAMGSIITITKNNQIHSFNGKPAIIRANGQMMWYEKGKLLKTEYPSGYTMHWRPLYRIGKDIKLYE